MENTLYHEVDQSVHNQYYFQETIIVDTKKYYHYYYYYYFYENENEKEKIELKKNYLL